MILLPVILFLQLFYIDGIFYSSSIMVRELLIDRYCKDCDIQSFMNLFFALSTGSIFLASIPSALSIAFIGTIPTLALSIGITALGYMLTIIIESHIGSLISYALIVGMGTGSVFYSSLIILSEAFNKSQLGFVTAIVITGSSLGSIIFPISIPQLLKIINYKWILVNMFIGTLKMCFLCFLLSYDKINFKSANKSKKESNKICNVSILIIMNIFTLAAFPIVYSYLLTISIKYGTPESYASLLISIIGLVNIPGRLIYGLLSDKGILSPIILNGISTLISGLSLALLPLLKYYYWSQIIFAIFFAIGCSGYLTLTTMYVIDIIGIDSCNQIMSLINVGRGIGALIGPLTAVVIERYSNENLVFYYTAFLFGIASIMCLCLGFKHDRKPIPIEESNELL